MSEYYAFLKITIEDIRGVIIQGPDPDPEVDFRTFWHFLASNSNSNSNF